MQRQAMISLAALSVLVLGGCVPGVSIIAPPEFRLLAEGSGLARLEAPGVGGGAAVFELNIEVDQRQTPFGISLGRTRRRSLPRRSTGCRGSLSGWPDDPCPGDEPPDLGGRCLPLRGGSPGHRTCGLDRGGADPVPSRSDGGGRSLRNGADAAVPGDRGRHPHPAASLRGSGHQLRSRPVGGA